MPRAIRFELMTATKHRDTSIYCQQGPEFLPATSTGSLSGFRFVFKDLFDFAGYITGAGNPKWLESHSPATETSFLILRLLSEGADCVGRVQTDELAYSLNGQNVHYGTPENPLSPDSLPGGSSSGSAVAVARKEADFSLGTDTGGAIRVPASYCGLYGLRPTLGKLSLKHCFALAESFDTVGIMSSSRALLSAVFHVLCGQEARSVDEPAQRLIIENTFATQLGKERSTELQKWCLRSDIELLYIDSSARLLEAGCGAANLGLLFQTIQGFEIIQKHGEWLSHYGESLDPAIAQRIEWARTITEGKYRQAKNAQEDFRQEFLCQLREKKGLWVLPTTPGGPPKRNTHAATLARYRSELMELTSLASLSGCPQLHLPVGGLPEGGPCGISLLGPPDSERKLLATAASLRHGI